MAYTPIPDQPVVNPAPAPNAPVSAGGQGVVGKSNTPATPGQNVPAQPSAQLSAYLGANQPQATALGQNIAQNVGAQVQGAGNAILPAVNTYTGQLVNVPTDTATNQAVASSPSSLTPAQQASYQAELGAAAQAPNSANTFETTAPYANLVTNIQNAVGQANLWNAGNNPASISTALQPYETNNATTGDTTLDALLLSGTPSAYAPIQAAIAPAANLQQNLTAGANTADQALQAAIAADQAATASAQAAPQTYATNLTNYLQGVISGTEPGITAQNAQIMSDLAANTPTQADLTALGVTPEQWTALSSEMQQTAGYGVPITLSNYLTQTAPNITTAEAATPTQYADIAALQNILGSNAPIEPISSVNAGQAGQFPTLASLNQFNLAGAETAAQSVPQLETQAQNLLKQKTFAIQQYGINHFGGQSQSQMNGYLNQLASQAAALNSQLQAAGAKPIDFGNVWSVPASDQGNSEAIDIGNPFDI